jgi:NTP pyrophosphatase (non-canonical NTP hydrolase)
MVRGRGGQKKRRPLDETTTVARLKELVETFVAARAWQQFHTPKNVSMALAIEASELMDIFKWASSDQSVALMRQRSTKKAATEEIADIVIYCLALANRAGIDVSRAVAEKILKNQQKYPVRKFRGRY